MHFFVCVRKVSQAHNREISGFWNLSWNKWLLNQTGAFFCKKKKKNALCTHNTFQLTVAIFKMRSTFWIRKASQSHAHSIVSPLTHRLSDLSRQEELSTGWHLTGLFVLRYTAGLCAVLTSVTLCVLVEQNNSAFWEIPFCFHYHLRV